VKHPSTKHQLTEKFQTPDFNAGSSRALLEVGAWSFSGAWMLELGAFYL
jgi:hypothetical protein